MKPLALAIFMSVLPAFAIAQDIQGPAKVIDGDTMIVGEEHVRLHGVTAPGLNDWPWGAFARATLDELAHGKTVACQIVDSGPRRHPAVLCSLPGDSAFGDKTLGEAMIRAGFAAHQRLATHGMEPRAIADRYDAAEQAAQAERVGIWGAR